MLWNIGKEAVMPADTQKEGDRQDQAWSEDDYAIGGDPVCWAHLLCPECGAVMGDSHRPGCSWNGRTTEN